MTFLFFPTNGFRGLRQLFWEMLGPNYDARNYVQAMLKIAELYDTSIGNEIKETLR